MEKRTNKGKDMSMDIDNENDNENNFHNIAIKYDDIYFTGDFFFIYLNNKI
jgi:hypothetical protein